MAGQPVEVVMIDEVDSHMYKLMFDKTDVWYFFNTPQLDDGKNCPKFLMDVIFILRLFYILLPTKTTLSE